MSTEFIGANLKNGKSLLLISTGNPSIDLFFPFKISIFFVVDQIQSFSLKLF
jgi:hypothetical protein